MNSNQNNTPSDDFDLDKILAEVKAMAANEPLNEKDDSLPKPLLSTDTLPPGTPAQTATDDDSDTTARPDYAIYTSVDSFTPADWKKPEELTPPEMVEDGSNEDSTQAPELETELEPDFSPPPAPKAFSSFNEQSGLPWWETPEAEEIFGSHKATKPPEEIIIEPQEPPQVLDEPEPTPDLFADMPAEPQKSDAPDFNEIPGFLSGMETDEARERFLSVFVLEKTAEHELVSPNDPIEKPGVIVEKGVSARTSDLEPMPTVLPAEEVLRADRLAQDKTRISGAPPTAPPEEKKDVLDGQIILKGFECTESQPEKVSETSVEEDLLVKRREKAKSFIKLIGIPEEEDENKPLHTFRGFEEISGADEEDEDEDDGQTHTPAKKKSPEYRFPEQKNRIYASIHSAVKKTTASTLALAIVELLCLGLLALPTFFESAVADSPLLAAGGAASIFLNLMLLSVACFFSTSVLISGYKALVKLKPNCDTAASLAVTACALHLLLALFIKPTGNFVFSSFCAAAVFVLLLNFAARKISHSTALNNFRFCAFDAAQNLYSIGAIEDANDAFEIGRGILMGNPAVIYSAKTDFPTDFVANAKDIGLAENLCKFLVPATSGVAVLTGIVTGLVFNNFLFGFSMFTAAMCLGVPAGALLASVLPLHSANKRLNLDGAMIANQDAAEECAKSNAVVLDSADIFDRARCDMHGMKEYKNFRLDDVLLYTAAMVIHSGGPLTDVFDKVIAGHRELLPPVKSFSYEDRQGISALIHGHKILLGNRTFLVNHSIDVPNKTDEDKYKHDGRKILYLAIANKIAAIFVVSYKADENLLPYLQVLENNGIQLLVRTCDANITEDLLSDCLALPITNIKVISATAGRLFQRLREKVKETAPARVMHNGSALTLLKSIATASGLNVGIRAAQIVQTVGVGIGLVALIVLIVLLAAPEAVISGINALQIIVFQAFWSMAALAAGLFKRVK